MIDGKASYAVHSQLRNLDRVGLLEKYSRPPASLFFGADIGGGVLDREIAFGTPVTIVLASRAIEQASQVAIPICLCATKCKTQERRRRPSQLACVSTRTVKTGVPHPVE
jgi:hypothetical protein